MSDTGTAVDNATATDPTKVRDPEVKLEHLARLKQELLDHMTELHTKDTEEKEALKNEVTRLTKYIDELEAAKQARDKIQPDDTTLVLPPNDIPIQQPNQANADQTGPSGGGGEAPAKKGFFKSIW